MWAPQISINTTQIPSDNPHTPPRYPQDNSREHKTPTETKRHKQTASDSPRHCQLLFEYVCWRLLASVCVCWCLLAPCVLRRCLGGVWEVYWGCLMVSEWYLWKSEAVKCVWGVSGLSVLAVRRHSTIFGKTLKSPTFFTWRYWGIKISKCLYVSLTKMIGVMQFLCF